MNDSELHFLFFFFFFLVENIDLAGWFYLTLKSRCEWVFTNPLPLSLVGTLVSPCSPACLCGCSDPSSPGPVPWCHLCPAFPRQQRRLRGTCPSGERQRDPSEKCASRRDLFFISLLILSTDSGCRAWKLQRNMDNWKKNLNDRLCLKAVLLLFF